MRIGELSSRTGVSRRLLRYYEERGLVQSQRSGGGQRVYTEEHVRRVTLVRTFLAAGMSSRAISEIIPCMAAPSLRLSQRASETMTNERGRLTFVIDTVSQARIVLDELIAENTRYQETMVEAPATYLTPGPERDPSQFRVRPAAPSTVRPGPRWPAQSAG